MHRAPANDILVTAFSNQIFGLDVASGQIRWEVVPPQGFGEIELAIEDGVVIAANSSVIVFIDVSVAFIDYMTGHVHAIVPLTGNNRMGRPTMIIAGGHLFIGRSGEVRCMTLRGQPVWTKELLGRGMRSLSLGFPGNIRQADR